MTWNYRIIDHGDWLGVHEVFYDEKGKPASWTADPVEFAVGKKEGAPGVIASLALALAGCSNRPVLKLVTTKKGKEKLKEV